MLRAGRRSHMGNDRTFTRTNGTIKNDPIIPKKNERIERVLKNIGTICKGTERLKKKERERNDYS